MKIKMLFACIKILPIAVPSLRISSLLRIVTIVLTYTAVIAFFTVYIQSIGSGMVIFSELFILALIPVKPGEDPSQRGPSNGLTKEEKAALSVPNHLKEILVGLLLGDLYAQKRNVNVRLRFGQGVV